MVALLFYLFWVPVKLDRVRIMPISAFCVDTTQQRTAIYRGTSESILKDVGTGLFGILLTTNSLSIGRARLILLLECLYIA